MSLFSFGSDKSKERVWRPQGDALRGLYGQTQQADLPGAGIDASRGLQPFIDQAQQTATGQNPVLQNLAGLATGGQDYSQGMIDNLSQNLGRFYQEQLLPGIQSNAIQSGGLGGGRQGIAQGLAAGRTADAFSQGVNNINFQQQGIQNQAAQTYGGLQAQGIGQGMQGIGAQFGFGVDPYLQLANIYGTAPGTLNSSKGYRFGIGGDNSSYSFGGQT